DASDVSAGSVGATHRQCATVPGEPERPAITLQRERRDLLLGREVPQLHPAVVAGGGERLAVRSERESAHALHVTLERRAQLAPGHLPEPRVVPLQRTGREESPIR